MPLIQEGIVPPVRNPTQSLVKELQLKSKPEFQLSVDAGQFYSLVYLGGGTGVIIRIRISIAVGEELNLLCSVMGLHLYQVLVKGIFIEGSLAQIKHL